MTQTLLSRSNWAFMLARAVAIILLGFIAYASMLSAPFRVMDDRISIVDNPMIKSAQNIPALFREGYFHDQSYYRPLINLSFMGEYKVFGLKAFFYNLDNLILHILNALLVVLLVFRLVNNESIAFWVGLLFVMHPVQWEAVCNIPGRAILLSAFFVLSAFTLFLEFYKTRQILYLVLVLMTFFAGLLCKESSGVLPFVIITFLATDAVGPWADKIKSLWPFLIGIAGYILLRQSLGITNIHHTAQPDVLLLGFVTFLRSVITDLRLFLFPVDLHYDRSLPFFMSLSQPQAWGSCLFWTLGLLGYMFYYRKIPNLVRFLIIWFLIELLPVSQLVASIGVGAGHVSTAEHFLYLASIPALMGMVIFFQWIYRLNLEKNFARPLVLKILAGGFLIFFLVTAIEQSIYASNEYNMIARSLFFEPNNPRIQAEMAMLSIFRKDIPDAEKHFRAAIKAEPMNPSFHIGLGTNLCQQGRFIEGLEQFVAFDPGKYKDLVKRQELLAIAQIRRQIALGENFDFRGWLAIGIYEEKTGHNPDAIKAFLKCISLNPSQPDAWFNLGSLYEAQKNWPLAKRAYTQLLSLPGLSFFQKEYAQEHLAGLGEGL